MTCERYVDDVKDAHLSKRSDVTLRTALYIWSIVLLAGCSGGSSNSAPVGSNIPGSPTVQEVSGTLTIATPVTGASSRVRKPAFVSASTKHAAVFIDGATTAAGSTTTCSAETGTGTGCTISWSAQLAVPASHAFAVETDTGTNSPANTVLSEGKGTYAVVAGTNTLAALSLNGVAVDATFAVTSCSGASPNSLCSGTVVLADAAGNAIAYTGATVVPATGNSPSSGNVFDNGNVTFVSSNSVAGLVTGLAQTSGGNTFSALASNTLTVSGVNTTGTYTYQVTCNGGATGTFGITVGGAATPPLDVTAPELAGLSTAVAYPSAGITTLGTAPSFNCASGVISSATGTLPVN
jgi:hypothetical protein